MPKPTTNAPAEIPAAAAAPEVPPPAAVLAAPLAGRRAGRPLNPDSPTLQLQLDPVDGVKDELDDVARTRAAAPTDVAEAVLLYCRGRYARIYDRVVGGLAPTPPQAPPNVQQRGR